jgi:hypothetical protein
VTVEYSGPLFDGTAGRLLRSGADEAEDMVAVAARDAVRDVIRQRARNRTGYYESRVRVDNAGGDKVVTATGLVYDDWLQGSAPRNAHSSFKGYRQWDAAAREVDARATTLVERTLAPYINKMG